MRPWLSYISFSLSNVFYLFLKTVFTSYGVLTDFQVPSATLLVQEASWGGREAAEALDMLLYSLSPMSSKWPVSLVPTAPTRGLAGRLVVTNGGGGNHCFPPAARIGRVQCLKSAPPNTGRR